MPETVSLKQGASIGEVSHAARVLGYDLSDEDLARVYESFGALAAKKPVSARELDAIIANAALQVPPTYRLVSYVVNSGNIIAATAHIVLTRNGESVQGLSSGDGPIDAALMAIEKIIGHHYELDDFQLQSVTSGREAMGEALVKLRDGGKLYSGRGISTDIVGASIPRLPERAQQNCVPGEINDEAFVFQPMGGMISNGMISCRWRATCACRASKSMIWTMRACPAPTAPSRRRKRCARRARWSRTAFPCAVWTRGAIPPTAKRRTKAGTRFCPAFAGRAGCARRSCGCARGKRARARTKRMKTCARWSRRCFPEAEHAGVTLLIETAGIYADTRRLSTVLKAFACDSLCALWDVHHPYRFAGESPETTITNLGAYVKHVHLKDSVAAADGSVSYCLLGEGTLPLGEVFDALRSVSYDGFYSLEWDPAWQAELNDPSVVLAHFASVVKTYQPSEKWKQTLYKNRAGTGRYVWRHDELINMTFPQVLDRMVEEFPDQLCFKFPTLDYTRTYSQFRDDVDACARALISIGVEPGQQGGGVGDERARVVHCLLGDDEDSRHAGHDEHGLQNRRGGISASAVRHAHAGDDRRLSRFQLCGHDYPPVSGA